jgi:general secretion pathway protein D
MVPFVGDIPVAGNLFKNRSKQKDRRNLMVFIRPTILRDQSAAARATSKKLDYLQARELMRTGRANSALDRLIEDATGLAPLPGSVPQSLPETDIPDTDRNE